MNRPQLLLVVFLTSVFLISPLPIVCAAITGIGDVEPTNPATWTSATTGYVGNTSNGTVTVNSGSAVATSIAYLGFNSGVTGVVTVAGTGSTWTNNGLIIVGYVGNGALNMSGGAVASSDSGGFIGYGPDSSSAVTVDGIGSAWADGAELYVGFGGSGTLNITNGSSVAAGGTTYVAYGPTSAGAINFNSNGGTLTTASLAASPTQLTGTGTINARGLMCDRSLVFDSAASLKQTFILNGPNQYVTINLDLLSPGWVMERTVFHA